MFELSPGHTSHNHAATPFPSQPHHRRLTEEQKSHIEHYVRSGQRPATILSLFRLTYPDHPLRRIDLYNLIGRIRREDRQLENAPPKGQGPGLHRNDVSQLETVAVQQHQEMDRSNQSLRIEETHNGARPGVKEVEGDQQDRGDQQHQGRDQQGLPWLHRGATGDDIIDAFTAILGQQQ